MSIPSNIAIEFPYPPLFPYTLIEIHSKIFIICKPRDEMLGYFVQETLMKINSCTYLYAFSRLFFYLNKTNN